MQKLQRIKVWYAGEKTPFYFWINPFEEIQYNSMYAWDEEQAKMAYRIFLNQVQFLRYMDEWKD